MFGAPALLGFTNQLNNTDLMGDIQMFDRLKRDLKTAAPNSVRTKNAGSVWYIEFAPAYTGGMYDPGSLSLYVIDNDFNTLGPDPAISTCTDCRIMIGQVGAPGSDIYDAPAVSNVARHPTAVTGSLVQLDPGMWAETSPAARWTATTGPVTYELDPNSGIIRRHWGYGWFTAQPTTFVGFSALLSRQLCSVNVQYTPTAQRRAGVEFNLRYCSPDRRNYSDMFHTVFVDLEP